MLLRVGSDAAHGDFNREPSLTKESPADAPFESAIGFCTPALSNNLLAQAGYGSDTALSPCLTQRPRSG